VVTPGGLSCIPQVSADFGLPADASDAERRLRLAAWITDPRNPVTPRVIVNRVWQYHFGRGLVASPSDFGVGGETPTHPQLLDWMASWFTGSGSSLKQLHRLILNSNTYKQSARLDPRAMAVDAENRLLWRHAPARMEAEELRDAMLAASGELNPAMGGPGFRPFDVVVNNNVFYEYQDKVGPEFNRRSIYRTAVNGGGVPLLQAFDCPDPSVKTPRRSTTTTPLQALALLNGSFVLRQAHALAKRLEVEAGPTAGAQVDHAYRLLYARSPTAAERERDQRFTAEHGLALYCRVLFNTSEFVYVR